jgi:hypothetical protein
LSAKNDAVLVIDEPDVYLHPDLQRKLFHLATSRAGQTIMATHSIEIMNEAETDEIIVIDKSARAGRRVRDQDGLQAAVASLGSTQNIYLTRLAQGKKILFVEGDDIKLLRRFARKLGLRALQEQNSFVGFPLRGFSNSGRIENVAWTFANILRSSIGIAAVFDRDYRCDADVESFVAQMRSVALRTYVLGKKEIENYLLAPTALRRAVNAQISRREDTVKPPVVDQERIDAILMRVTEEIVTDVKSQYFGFRRRFYKSLDESTVFKECEIWFGERWATLTGRLQICPGKAVLAAFNRAVSDEYRVSLTHAQIVDALHVAEIDIGLRDLLGQLEEFASEG